MKNLNTKLDMGLLRNFVSASQLSMANEAEIKPAFLELQETIRKMPQTYGQDGMGDDAIAYLHYFKGGMDFYITEKDMEDDQLQAFGLAKIHEAEIGYISIEEIISAGVEVDLYFTPKTIRELKIELGGKLVEELAAEKPKSMFRQAIEALDAGDKDGAWAIAKDDPNLNQDVTKEVWLSFAEGLLKDMAQDKQALLKFSDEISVGVKK